MQHQLGKRDRAWELGGEKDRGRSARQANNKRSADAGEYTSPSPTLDRLEPSEANRADWLTAPVRPRWYGIGSGFRAGAT